MSISQLMMHAQNNCVILCFGGGDYFRTKVKDLLVSLCTRLCFSYRDYLMQEYFPLKFTFIFTHNGMSLLGGREAVILPSFENKSSTVINTYKFSSFAKKHDIAVLTCISKKHSVQ